MTARWLIVADDLTGAADCAIPFARRGLDTVVSWGGDPGEAAQVLSIDADTRQLPAAEAAARQVAALAAHWRPGVRLYKKLDSTLRGQPAAELAAQLSALASGAGRRAPLAVVAPAFPATGRVTQGGRILVDGLPLEGTPLWARDHSYASAALPDVLASAGLTAEVIALDDIRAGPGPVLDRMRGAERRGAAAVVCDCTSHADLAVVAAASRQLVGTVWVGSAGLAAALAAMEHLENAPASMGRPLRTQVARPVLTVVGSLAEASRRQARALVESRFVTHVAAAPEILLAGARAPGYRAMAQVLSDTLAAGEDVLLETVPSASPDLARGAELAASLAALVAPVAPAIGALVATGGQTARALLSRLGVHGIRLLDEVEPGVPLGITLGALSIPVVTKAGEFGDADTLCRCLARLEDGPAAPAAT